MVSPQVVDSQLESLGISFKYFGRSEVQELQNILLPGELIEHAANGVYSGGFAMIVATNLRLLIIDKKPFKLNIEDIRYQTISEVGFQGRILDAMLMVNLPHKLLTFRSWHQPRLRNITNFIQERVMQASPDWQQRYKFGFLSQGQSGGIGMRLPAQGVQQSDLTLPQPFLAKRTPSALRSALSRLAIKQLYSTSVYSA